MKNRQRPRRSARKTGAEHHIRARYLPERRTFGGPICTRREHCQQGSVERLFADTRWPSTPGVRRTRPGNLEADDRIGKE